MNTALQILPAEGWPHNQLIKDYKSGAQVWREVSEEFYHEMLNVLPPMDWKHPSFLVSEAYTHSTNDTIYCGLTMVKGRFYARYVPRKQFSLMLLELKLALIK